jgi:hypothetical protein
MQVRVLRQGCVRGWALDLCRLFIAPRNREQDILGGTPVLPVSASDQMLLHVGHTAYLYIHNFHVKRELRAAHIHPEVFRNNLGGTEADI